MTESVKLFESEQEAWEVAWGTDGASFRSLCERRFREMFEHGHRTSLRAFVSSCTELEHDADLMQSEKAQYLRDVHPDAFVFLAAHGIDYRPYAWKKWPDFGLEGPENAECFKNSWRLMYTFHSAFQDPDIRATPGVMRRAPALYVEGICMGAVTSPMLHAWNALGHSKPIAFDWTHAAAARWDRYLGFPVSHDEYETAMNIASPGQARYISLFCRTTFPKVRAYLESLAITRDEQRCIKNQRVA